MEYFSNCLDIIHHLAIAAICGIIIGKSREKANTPAGVKTHTSVAIGAAMVMYLAIVLLYRHGSGDPIGRVIAGVLQGIGFLGAGIIITDGEKVVGLTSAATIWFISIVGMFAGSDYWLLAIVISISYVVIIGLENYFESRHPIK